MQKKPEVKEGWGGSRGTEGGMEGGNAKKECCEYKSKSFGERKIKRGLKNKKPNKRQNSNQTNQTNTTPQT